MLKINLETKNETSQYYDYYYYVGVVHLIGIRPVVKFPEVLCQKDSSNLKNHSEDPCRI